MAIVNADKKTDVFVPGEGCEVDSEIIRGGQILSDMHYFMQDDLRKFCERLNPDLENIDIVHLSKSFPITQRVWQALLAFVIPAFLPCLFAQYVMSWPQDTQYNADTGEVVATNLLVESNTIKYDPESVRVQILLADPHKSLLIAPVFVMFLLLVKLALYILHKWCGPYSRQAHHLLKYYAIGYVKAKLRILRLVSRKTFESVAWAYFALILSIIMFSMVLGSAQLLVTGAFVGYVAGEVYLQIAEGLAGFVAGPDGDAMIAAYSGTWTSGHDGLWERLDSWPRSVFPAKASELAALSAHASLAKWSDDKLQEKIEDPELPEVSTLDDAMEFTYGSHRIIKCIWVLDSSQLIHLHAPSQEVEDLVQKGEVV